VESQDLIHELRARGLVAEGVSFDAARVEAERPWFVSLLLGAAGWIAGLFVLVIAFMIFRFDSHGGAFVAGVVLLGSAWGLFKADREGAFVSQLALALSIAGQFAALFAVTDMFFKSSHEFAGIAFVALVLQCALVVAMPNALHRTMSAFFACIAWAVLVRYGLWDRGDISLFSRRAPPEPSVGLALAGWMVAWLPVAGVIYMVIRREAAWISRGWQSIVRPAAIGLVAGLAVTTLVSEPFEAFPWVDAATGRGGFSVWPLLSAIAALAAMVAAFALGHRGLTAICVIAALVHVTHFYYAMGTSLLLKSVTMIALGALCLWLARRWRSP
jgi:hypothetical protein